LIAPGFGPDNFYYVRHDATGASTFGTIFVTGLATGTVTDRFGVGSNVTDLTFTATDVGMGADLFYYLRDRGLSLTTNIVTVLTTNTVITLTTNTVTTFTTNSTVTLTPTNIVMATGVDICQGRTVEAAANCTGPLLLTSPGGQAPITGGISKGMFSLLFPTENGQSYTVQYKNHLSDPTWTNLETVAGTGGEAGITDAIVPGRAARFYRVILTP